MLFTSGITGRERERHIAAVPVALEITDAAWTTGFVVTYFRLNASQITRYRVELESEGLPIYTSPDIEYPEGNSVLSHTANGIDGEQPIIARVIYGFEGGRDHVATRAVTGTAIEVAPVDPPTDPGNPPSGDTALRWYDDERWSDDETWRETV